MSKESKKTRSKDKHTAKVSKKQKSPKKEKSVDGNYKDDSTKPNQDVSDVEVNIIGDSFLPFSSFKDTKYHKKVLDVCSKFEKPSPIQSYSWPALKSGRDLIGIAETGSGKTLAFALPVISKIFLKEKIKALILSPTRELAIQIQECFKEAAEKIDSVKSVVIYGGTDKSEQRKILRKGPNVIVATPGRLIDFMENEELSLESFNYIVLDEADRMLDLGFEAAVRKILSQVSSEKQMVMFSATWPNSIQKLAVEFLKNPVKITIGKVNELNACERIQQIVEVVQDPESRPQKLLSLLKKYHVSKTNKILIFVLYKKEAPRIEKILYSNGYNVSSIHGDKNQNQRNEAIENFKAGKVPILVATDVAARGLDVQDVSHVINYSFPLTIEDYVHRIGRTGRGGKSGISHTFFTPLDKTHSGALINLLKSSNADVPSELLKFGTTVKKKEHKEYGAFYKDIDPNAKANHITFDD